MFLTLTVPSHGSLRWRFAPYWARITVHKELVLMLVMGGALAGLLVSAAAPKVYAARAIIRIDASAEFGCGGCFSATERPLPVRLASQIDAAALWLRLPSPKLQDRMAKWIDN